MGSLRDESEALDVVSRAIVKRTGTNRAELTLSNGIVFEFIPVSPVLTNSVRAELELRIPPVPRVWLEEKGREEENPNDPDYLAALRRQEQLNEMALSDALSYAGCKVKFVPEGYFKPEEDGWLTDPRIEVAVHSGLEFDPADPIKRKVVWMRLYAIETYIDARLWDEVQVELMGMREEEVQEALAGFRPVSERGASDDIPPENISEDGNTDNRAARRARLRVRGA